MLALLSVEPFVCGVTIFKNRGFIAKMKTSLGPDGTVSNDRLPSM
jgi:hypothetical protein